MENANKLVVEARLKGAGMSWGEGALNPMLALRNAVCNDRWAEGWEKVRAAQEQAREEKRSRQRGRPSGEAHIEPGAEQAGGEVNSRVVAEVEAILEKVAGEIEEQREQAAIVDGKPGAGHPWRKSPIGKRVR